MIGDFFHLYKKRFPFLGLVLAAISGILIQEFFSFPSWAIFLTSLLLGLFLLFFLWKNQLPRNREQFLFFLFVLLCFATLHAWQSRELKARAIALYAKTCSQEVVVEGRITSEPKISLHKNISFFLKVDRIDNSSLEIYCPITMFVRWEGPMIACGDRVTLRGMIRLPQAPRNPGEFNTVAWLAQKDVCTELEMDPADPGHIVSRGLFSCAMDSLARIKRKIEHLITLGITDDKSVCKLMTALVLGAQEQELADFIADFKLTGTMHLFAVSGLHVGMLAMIIWFAFNTLRLPRFLSVVLTMPLLFFYVAITGFRIGSLRAVLMTSLVLSGLLLYRRTEMINSLAAAAFLLLLWQTNILFSMGWQFSFCVVFSIFLLATPCQKILNRLYRLDPFLPKKLISPSLRWGEYCWKHITQLIAVSLAAWMGTLVPCIFYFHLISFSSLVANVVAVPIAFCILSLAAISGALGSLFPWVASVFNNCNWLFAKLLLLVIHAFTFLPFSVLPISLSKVSNPKLTIFDFPSARVVALQTEGRTWLINTGRAKNATQSLLPFCAQEGITSLQGVILTDQKSAEVGGLLPLSHHLEMPAFYAALETEHNFIARFVKNKSAAAHQTVLAETFQSSKRTLLHTGDSISLSSHCSAEVLYPPADSSDTVLVLKLYLGQATVLLMPSYSPALQAWLLDPANLEKLHASILIAPVMDTWNVQETESFLQVLARIFYADCGEKAPRLLVLGSPSWSMHHHGHTITPRLASDLKEYGVTLFDQTQTGAVILDVLPEKIKLHGFFNHEDYVFP